MMAAHTPQASPFRFLDLPFDVREHVYYALLALQDPAPPDPKLQPRYGIPAVDKRNDPFIYALLAHPQPTIADILLTNRQIYSELVAVVERRSRPSSHGIWYTLDIFASDTFIYPTWVAFPAPRRYLSHVNIVFRTDGWSGRPSLHGFGDDKTFSLVESLVQLLSEFLVYGPSFIPVKSCDFRLTRKPVVLNDLSIEFVREVPVGRSRFSMARLLDSDDPNVGCMQSHTVEGLDGYDELNHAMMDVDGILSRFAESGLLWGRVKKFRFKFEGWSKEWEVVEREPEEMRKVAEEMAEIGWKSMADMIEDTSKKEVSTSLVSNVLT